MSADNIKEIPDDPSINERRFIIYYTNYLINTVSPSLPQLFHFINMWIFNQLLAPPHQPSAGLCTMAWGVRLLRRLSRIATWAKKQGLELAADCHLSRVMQGEEMMKSSIPFDMFTVRFTLHDSRFLLLENL